MENSLLFVRSIIHKYMRKGDEEMFVVKEVVVTSATRGPQWFTMNCAGIK